MRFFLMMMGAFCLCFSPLGCAEDERCPVRTELKKGKYRSWCEKGNGTKHGVYLAKFTNGRTKEKGNFTNGKKDGTFVYYFKVRSQVPPHGDRIRTKPECTPKENPNRKKLVASFKMGKKHGTWREWYKNGNKRSVGKYSKGKKHGTWRHWNSWCIQMDHSSPVVWKNGRRISVGKKKK